MKKNILKFQLPNLNNNKNNQQLTKKHLDKIVDDVYILVLQSLINKGIFPKETDTVFHEDMGWSMALLRCSLYSLVGEPHHLNEYAKLIQLQYSLIPSDVMNKENKV